MEKVTETRPVEDSTTRNIKQYKEKILSEMETIADDIRVIIEQQLLPLSKGEATAFYWMLKVVCLSNFRQFF
jgi:hypothetical protein